MELTENRRDDTTSSDIADFEFDGTASEYFRIWIVNLLLSVMTLGIYSAWAKVRRKKYFYRSTRLRGDRFDYHADPVKILKGRLIAVSLVALYIAASYALSGLELVIIILIFLVSPWLIVKSRQFNARNSSFRNIRFSFRQDLRDAYKVYIGYALLIPFTLGLIVPYALFARNRFIIVNSGYGRSFFSFHARPGTYYRIFLGAAGLFLLFFLFAVFSMPFFLQVAGPGDGTAGEFPPTEPDSLTAFLPFVVLLFAYLVPGVYFATRVQNTVFSNARLAGHELRMDLRVLEMLGIYITNMLAIVLSVGLAIPWARVRTVRYRLSRLQLEVTGSLDEFLAAEESDVAATGEEVGDFFDIDIGL